MENFTFCAVYILFHSATHDYTTIEPSIVTVAVFNKKFISHCFTVTRKFDICLIEFEFGKVTSKTMYIIF